MKMYSCQSCGTMVFFENAACETCGHALGYLPEPPATITALEPDGDDWRPLATPDARMRYCDNAEFSACNWLIPVDSDHRLCPCCRHNSTIPDVSVPVNLERWRKIELAKHRLFYSLLKWRLPVPASGEDDEPLLFDILADLPGATGPKVMTGHDNGRITIALKEADDAERVALREAMAEPYRTLLGHFRHEIGHYYWDKLVRDGGKLDSCRAVFGDDREDYEAALKRHYKDGVPPNWVDTHISAYATTHAWEDFAETWAHYLHIVDTLDTARSFGLTVRPRVDPSLSAEVDFDPYRAISAQQLVDEWLPLTYAVNSLNRSMGQPDLYPFVLSAPVVTKLQFVHELVQTQAASG